jgi:hypothetical protein
LKNRFIVQCGFVEPCKGESKGFMRKSVICFLVALTLLPLGLAFVPRVSSQSQAPDIKILSYNYYIDSAGFFDVVGEVKNMGSTTLTSVIIAGSVYSEGMEVGDTYAPIGVEPMVVNYLLPQQQAPFYMTFYAPNSQVTSQTSWSSIAISNVYLSVAHAAVTSNYTYPDLDVTGVTTSIGTGSNAGAYFVNGYVQNTGAQTAQNVTVLGTFYDSKGDTVGVGNSNTTASLSPSAKAPFILPAWDINDSELGPYKITSYSFLILVQDPILQGTPPTVTPYPNAGLSSSNPTSSPTSSPPSSSSSSPSSSNSLGGKNNLSNLFNPSLIAIIAVVAVVAVVGVAVGLRKNKQSHISTMEKIKPKPSELTKETIKEPIKPKPKPKPKPSELIRERRVQSKPRESTKEKIKRRRREKS